MPRPLRAFISVSALSHNLAVARRHAPGARVWAVVKAAAYGHGLEAARRGFAQADGLAVVEFDAALRLRAAGWTRPILMLEGAFDATDVALACEQGLSLVVHDGKQVEWLRTATSPLDVHLKFNSGMNRLGFRHDAFRAAWSTLRGLPQVRDITLMTHFANADVGGGTVDAQAAFEHACQGLPGDRSLANSAATIDLPSTHAQWIRPGIMLYGASPFADRHAVSLGLRPAMRLLSQVIAVQHLQPGDAVGYGSLFTAQAPMRIGIVACGYADGYPRHAPTGTPVLVDGVRSRVVGRVSMDMMMIDLSPVPQAQVGAEVELWGGRLSVDEVATSSGTIGYELLCALAPRVPVTLED